MLIGAGVTLYGGWNAGTAIGVIAGEGLGDPATIGLDAAFPALFLALLASQLRNRDAVAAALAGAAIALVLVPVAPAGLPVIAATLACLVGLRRDPSGGAAKASDDHADASQDARPRPVAPQSRERLA